MFRKSWMAAWRKSGGEGAGSWSKALRVNEDSSGSRGEKDLEVSKQALLKSWGGVLVVLERKVLDVLEVLEGGSRSLGGKELVALGGTGSRGGKGLEVLEQSSWSIGGGVEIARRRETSGVGEGGGGGGAWKGRH